MFVCGGSKCDIPLSQSRKEVEDLSLHVQSKTPVPTIVQLTEAAIRIREEAEEEVRQTSSSDMKSRDTTVDIPSLDGKDIPDMEASVPIDSMCWICMDNDPEEMITLTSCSHSAHTQCLRGQLGAKWTGKRISFGYLTCGECRIPLAHPMLTEDLASHRDLEHRIRQLCVQKSREDGLLQTFADDRKPSAEGDIQEDSDDGEILEVSTELADRCVENLSCFLCTVCSEPFCGGRVDCAEAADLDVSTLCCAACAFDAQKGCAVVEGSGSSGGWMGKCHEHGYVYAVYKCDSCCAVATWDCRSNHYCERCHNQASSEKNYPCPGREACPLGIDHPPNKSAVHGQNDDGFVIGCSKCFLGDDLEEGFKLATDSSAEDAIQHWNGRF